MSIWRNFERIADAWCDAYFSEPIELHPMTPTEEVEIGAPTPDPNRSILYCIGIYVVPGAATSGESGSVATGRAMGGAAVLAQMEWVSVTEDQLGSPANWGPAVSRYDQVYLPERGTWHTINSITPSATGRFNINLTRYQAQ